MPEPTATETTRASIAAMAASLPMHDRQDFDDATRGCVARSDQRKVLSADGRVVWDLDAYDFLRGADAPETANPSLWRQGQLLIEDGLFEVVPGIYQLRGYDLSVMTVVEGDTGVIVIDPLISSETAAAAFGLHTAHRGQRPITSMIHTHSHVDHFGGVKGLIAQEQVDAGQVQVVAPEGFLHHAVAENIFAGPAMTRRAGYMFGAALDRGPAAQIGSGLGQTTSTGTITLIAPTVDVTHTGQTLTIDGVEIVFQMTPGTEAPAEMNFYFPRHRALCTAGNTSHTLHNTLTIRGAVVRDAHALAHYLTETIDLWGDELEFVFASHRWPTWGRERAVEFLAMQRDMDLYLHDQTLRMINQGYASTSADFLGALTVTQVLDSIAVRIDGPRAWGEHLRIAWTITDEGTTHLAELRNGTLHHRTVDGDPSVVARLVALLAPSNRTSPSSPRDAEWCRQLEIRSSTKGAGP